MSENRCLVCFWEGVFLCFFFRDHRIIAFFFFSSCIEKKCVFALFLIIFIAKSVYLLFFLMDNDFGGGFYLFCVVFLPFLHLMMIPKTIKMIIGVENIPNTSIFFTIANEFFIIISFFALKNASFTMRCILFSRIFLENNQWRQKNKNVSKTINQHPLPSIFPPFLSSIPPILPFPTLKFHIYRYFPF
jgi:hypothetical protein